ncbi:hypothetical protein [Dactylosporangium vinaceum]|uniref:Uncharacterized protein n=1 Tax=Dactylosporangium vinaceum TaxID=53362 RepID=A0ABV5MM80_9ACTN|nr:hypothetical protein [Dactylosporangium vinaceum]
MPDVLAIARAEALFVSSVQSSECPAPVAVRRAVAESFARLGSRGCAACVAGEFGDHPDAAVARMRWAIATVGAVYQRRRATTRGLALTGATCTT